jgi:hypothetical protein
VEVDWPEDPETVILIEVAGKCEAACICLEDGWLSWVEMLEDRCSGEGLLELLKGKFRFSSPFPFCRRLSFSFECAVGRCFKCYFGSFQQLGEW